MARMEMANRKTKSIRIESIVYPGKQDGEINIKNLPGSITLPVNKANEFGVIEQYVELHTYPWDKEIEKDLFIIYKRDDFLVGKKDNKFLIFYKPEMVVIATNIPEWMLG